MSDTIHKQTLEQAVTPDTHQIHTRDIQAGGPTEIHTHEKTRDLPPAVSGDAHCHSEHTREVVTSVPDSKTHDSKDDPSTKDKLKSAVGLGDKDSKHT